MAVEGTKRENEPKRCLVLGGMGFIGSHLVGALLDEGFFVRCFGLSSEKPMAIHFINNPRLEIIEGDFTNKDELAKALKGCDYCYHLISTTMPKTSNLDPVFDIQSNVVATVELLRLSVEYDVKKIIFVSSGGTVYGKPTEIPIPETHANHPVCSYGITKLAIEKYLALYHTLYGLDYTVLRLANPYGEGQLLNASQGAVAVFLGKILKGERIEIWGDGSVVRDYIYIQDVIRALMLSLPPSKEHHIYNIGSGQGHSLNALIQTIEEITNLKAKCTYKEARNFDVPTNILKISTAKDDLGWTPQVSFHTGIKRFANWIIHNR